MKYAVTVDDDVRAVLSRSTIAGLALTLPDEQLDRKLYEKVNKVLVAAGGKWNRSKKAHLFPYDPKGILGDALDAGHIVDTKKAEQQFFTPEPLARFLVATAVVRTGDRVLEPSAGAGAIATVIRNCGGDVLCVEKDPALVDGLRKERFHTLSMNFLHLEPNQLTDGNFDKVVMNPPFTGGQDIEHIMHAFGFLKPGGTLVGVMGAGIKSNSHSKAEAFRQFVDEQDGYFQDLPDDSFVESGTKVRTVMVVITK